MRNFEMVEETATYAAQVFTLGGAVDGRRAWSSTDVSDGDSVYYRASASATQWEIGTGTYSSAGTITRTATSTRPSGFSGEFSGSVSIAQVVPAASHAITNGTQTPRATHFQSAALAGGRAQAENALALMGATATHEGAMTVGFGAFSFAPYCDQYYGAVRWAGTASTFSGRTSDKLVDYGGGVLIIESYMAAACHCLVIGKRDTDQAVYAAEIRCLIRKTAGGTLAIVGTPTVTEIGKSAGVTVSASVSAANNGLTITANGNTEPWQWAATITAAGV